MLLTVPFKVAPEAVNEVGALVVAVGRQAAVVKVMSLPLVVPALFAPFARK